MVYYYLNVNRLDKVTERPEETARSRRVAERARAHQILTATEQYNSTVREKGFITIFSESDYNDEFVVILKKPECLFELFNGYVKALGLDIDPEPLLIEQTLSDIEGELETADRNDYILDSDNVLASFNLNSLNSYSFRFGENIICPIGPDGVDKFIERNLLRGTMKPEVERIRMGKSSKSKMNGIPAHYIFELSGDNPELRRDAARSLLDELYRNGRLGSKRYSFVDLDAGDEFNENALDRLYKSMAGGSVILRYSVSTSGGNDLATSKCGIEDAIARLLSKYKNTVQTIIQLPSGSEAIKRNILSALDNITVVCFSEDIVFDDRASEYLCLLAKEQNARTDKKLLNSIESGKAYGAADLNAIFDKWFAEKLHRVAYPQYSELDNAKKTVMEEKHRGSAYERLQELIGLHEAKHMVDKILNYYKAQKIFEEKGIIAEQPALHISLTGNPGSCKTTVARLLGEILKDNGILKKGEFFECGRADLVGKYVGWTATIVKQRFRDARDSVLLIDEAYSLVDDRTGSYGDEAINTIVQCMENMRDVVVIFAGYPDKMKEFLDRNPGLRSRINFNIHCADYSADELCDIAKLMAKDNGFRITDEAVNKIHTISESVLGMKDFGNGRFIRNLMENARMSVSSRLVSMDFDSIRDEDIVTITADDIEMPVMINTAVDNRQPIGFSA